MNEHQHRLWLRMLRAIERYRDGAINLSSLVGELQGALDAGEFRDVALTDQFYDFWSPLEIDNAVLGGEGKYEETRKEVDAMQRFLLEHLITEQLESS